MSAFLKTLDAVTQDDFDPAVACWLARCSEKIYPINHSENELVHEAHRLESMLIKWGFDHAQFFSGASTQCIVGVAEKHIVLCFRGTEPSSFRDIYDDLFALPIQPPITKGMMHAGFWRALHQVWKDANRAMLWPPSKPLPQTGLFSYLKKHRGVSSRKLWIAGHSLGGALATTAATRLLAEGLFKEQDIAAVYTFGQPRVGDARYSEQYELTAKHFRLMHANDIVTRVPPASLKKLGKVTESFLDIPLTDSWLHKLNYRHVGQLIIIRKGCECIMNPSRVQRIKIAFSERMRALQHGQGIVGKLMPGLGDHSMKKYRSVLEEMA
ncbi:MAG: lipase family protein [Pseudomonadota bacterium]